MDQSSYEFFTYRNNEYEVFTEDGLYGEAIINGETKVQADNLNELLAKLIVMNSPLSKLTYKVGKDCIYFNECGVSVSIPLIEGLPSFYRLLPESVRLVENLLFKELSNLGAV